MTDTNDRKKGNLKRTVVGVQLVNGEKYIGELVKSSVDYVWVKTKQYSKPIDIPKIIISRILFSLPEEEDGE